MRAGVHGAKFTGQVKCTHSDENTTSFLVTPFMHAKNTRWSTFSCGSAQPPLFLPILPFLKSCLGGRKSSSSGDSYPSPNIYICLASNHHAFTPIPLPVFAGEGVERSWKDRQFADVHTCVQVRARMKTRAS